MHHFQTRLFYFEFTEEKAINNLMETINIDRYLCGVTYNAHGNMDTFNVTLRQAERHLIYFSPQYFTQSAEKSLVSGSVR